MEINSEEILNKASGHDDRKKISLYLSADLYKKFQKICKTKNAPVSKVLELLLQKFINDAEKGGKSPRGSA